MINEMDLEKITVKIDGQDVECDVLATFDSEDKFKSYIIYTDNSIGENDRKNIFISAYNPLKTELKLEDITDSKELEMVQEVLMQLDEYANKTK